MIKVIKSSKIELLAKNLINELKSVNDFFSTPLIVVKNSNIEKWFKTYWLKNEESVLMNVKFCNFGEFVKATSKNSSFIATNDDIILAITDIILNGGINSSEVNDYVYDNGALCSIKVHDFAKELTYYYEKTMLNGINLNGWQLDLYESVVNKLKDYNLTLIKDYIDSALLIERKAPIFILGTCFIEKLYLEYITRLSQNNDLYLYNICSEDDKNAKEYMALYDNIEIDCDNTKVIKGEEKAIDIEINVAPSKVRELEVVHSKICELLKNKDVTLSDIVVYAPNMGDYISSIERVFNQDDIDFIDIPYVIKTTSKKESLLFEALDILFDIYHKEFYTRNDVYKLAGNRLIQKVRGLDDNFVSTLVDMCVNMNVYRKRKTSDDFEYAKKRLLLSKLVGNSSAVENIVKLNDKYALPYSAISTNDEVIEQYIALTNDLNSFLKLKDDKDFLWKIEGELDKWFSIIDNGLEVNKLYRKIKLLINDFILMHNDHINLDLLLTYLKESAVTTSSTFGEILTSGVTFLDLVDGNSMHAKYTFILGFNAGSMPRIDRTSEFYSLDELPKNIDYDKCAFFTQIQNTAKKLYISYLSKDLKTDETFYPSTLLDGVLDSKVLKFDKDNDGKVIHNEISLDENRSYKDLYTRKEYKSKDYYSSLFRQTPGEVLTDSDDNNYEYTYQDIVKLSDFKKFLEEPLRTKAERLMKKNEDNKVKVLEEYEPLSYDYLDKYNIVSDLLKKFLSSDKEDDEIISAVKDELTLTNDILDNGLSEISFGEIVKNAKTARDGFLAIGTDYEIKKLNDLVLTYNDYNWTLLCNKEMFVYDDGNHNVTYGILKYIDKPSEGDYLYEYVYALMDIASRCDSEDYNISLYGGTTLSTRKARFNKFVVNSAKAIELLNNIYEAYNDYNVNRLIPVSRLDLKVDSLNKLYRDRRSFWDNYSDKDMFDYETDWGYDDSNFDSEWNEASSSQKELILYKSLRSKNDE